MGGQLKYENLFSLYFVFKIFLVSIERGRASEGRAGGAAATRGKKRKHFSLSANTCQSALFQPWKMCVVTLIILKSMSYQRFTSQFKILHFNLVFKDSQRITFEKYCRAEVLGAVSRPLLHPRLISLPAPFTTKSPVCWWWCSALLLGD